MNSAEKKAPEPSMDDIISSIRNIIADDTQEATPVQDNPAVENQPPAIVQLTENQIAEPALDAANGVAAAPDVSIDEVPTLSGEIAEPAMAPSSVDLEIANEIDAVPGLAAAPVAPAATTPNLKISEPLAPATAVGAPKAEEVVAAAELPVTPAQGLTPAAVAEAIVAETGAPALPASVEQPAVTLEDDIAFVSPDPVEEMMQSVSTDQPELDAVNNGVDPDQILDGMEAAPVSESAPAIAPVVQEPVVTATPPIENIAEEAPVVLDASQVTPENAIAITAVADATSQAISGTSAPTDTVQSEQKQGGDSLEDSVKAMLKPMIREWLDDNMPRILEGAIKDDVDAPGNDKT